ncbi:hypothetical protein [Lacticaseibacillus nasuensis]|uniref:hypothetical protein n=1 Tax=Lacticaseibacillus nasuensis TaxID=944671 RepID=UPI0006D17483|nr:hypothetical protein [Lacticaseibacillus nasuensis]
MSWLQRRWQHLMTIHPRPDVYRWWQACLLFVWLLVGEQVVFAGYYTGHYMGADWFGLLLAIYFAWLYLKLPLAYGQNRNWPRLHLASMRRVGITVGGMFLTSQGWHWLGPIPWFATRVAPPVRISICSTRCSTAAGQGPR